MYCTFKAREQNKRIISVFVSTYDTMLLKLRNQIIQRLYCNLKATYTYWTILAIEVPVEQMRQVSYYKISGDIKS